MILLQEVRLDTGFVGAPDASGSQIEQLIYELMDAYANQGIAATFQFVYQPAMNMHAMNKLSEDAPREEEGLGIILRIKPNVVSMFHIIESDYLLLPRSLDDPKDDHQRIVLHIKVMSQTGRYIDFYNTHLSLSGTAREKSLQYFTDFVSLSDSRGTIVFGGDFNAEAHETAITNLLEQGQVDRVISELGIGIDGSVLAPESLHQPYKVMFTDFSSEKENTFPVNDPVKRIGMGSILYFFLPESYFLHVLLYCLDFILGRNDPRGPDRIVVLEGVRLVGGLPGEMYNQTYGKSILL